MEDEQRGKDKRGDKGGRRGKSGPRGRESGNDKWRNKIRKSREMRKQ